MARAAFLLCLLLAAPAAAHDYWLVPETFTPKDGANVPVSGAKLTAYRRRAHHRHRDYRQGR